MTRAYSLRADDLLDVQAIGILLVIQPRISNRSQLTKSSCKALSTVCSPSTLMLPANMQRGLLFRAVAQFCIAAQAAAEQGHGSVLRDVGLNRLRVRCRPALTFTIRGQRLRRDVPVHVQRARIVDARIERHAHRLAEIQAHALHLAATRAPTPLSPPARCRDPRPKCCASRFRTDANRISTAQRRRPMLAAAGPRWRPGSLAAAAPGPAPLAPVLGRATRRRMSLSRLNEPSGSSHVTSLTPVIDSESTCAWRRRDPPWCRSPATREP